MKLFAIILVLAATTWLFAACYRPLSASGFWWRVFFGVFTLIGMLCGMSLVQWTYEESPTLKLTGYPFTIAAAELVDGRWLGGLIARYHILAFLGNIGTGLFVFLIPFQLTQWLSHRLWRTNAIA